MAEEGQDCIFCQIANGQVPAKKVYEDASFMAVLDINPANPGHVLLLPKTHTSVYPQLSESDSSGAGMLCKKISLAMIQGLGVQGTTIFVANGGVAGQRAPHLIIHVIPRMQGDNLFQPHPVKPVDGMPTPADVPEGKKEDKGEDEGEEEKKDPPSDKQAAPAKEIDLDAIAEVLGG
ncbi:hypothetical protein CMO91_03580 [Candidatus Woesearchaeota archaeon]|nr:hypothetical protein [Candidatus Woesearchaeota archaeon]